MKNYKTNFNIIRPLRNHSPNTCGIVFVQQIRFLKSYRFIFFNISTFIFRPNALLATSVFDFPLFIHSFLNLNLSSSLEYHLEYVTKSS